MTKIAKKYDLVVVGGGLAGMSAAIAAARHGVKTALVQNRSVLGGNASSEIRVNVNGAGRGGNFCNAIESGIVLETLMANKKVNPQYSYHVWDTIMWEKANFQENLDLYLNTHMFGVKMDGNKVKEVTCVQTNTEKEFTFEAELFVDTTGDATLADLAGAEYTIGHESRDTYNESLAPEVADLNTMGSTIIFSMKDMGKPMPFKRPDWAYEFTDEKLGGRNLTEFTHGYWWMELGDAETKTIRDGEFIRNELLKHIYGLFDYMKNSGKYPVENHALDWIGTIPGKRESRRIIGDYVLNQNDIDSARRFDDAIAYGGWTMDDHSVGGLNSKGGDNEGTIWHAVDDVYTIPYRCTYSKNIENLYVGGRAMSASHMAMSSSRVMATLAVVGQAIGTASSFAIKDGILPREVGQKYIKELQQMLIKDDCYIPGIKVDDKDDLVTNLDCTITASSATADGQANFINGDYARRVGDVQNAWISEEMSENGEWIEIKFPKNVSVKDMIFRFDPNFSRTIIPAQGAKHIQRQVPEMPYELVRDYSIAFTKNGEVVKEIDTEDNFQRVNQYSFENAVCCDAVKVLVKSTYGDKHAIINDIRIYE
ncbi:MAG: FAD-dependent oxidoreductase [Clostridia bacterium]